MRAAVLMAAFCGVACGTKPHPIVDAGPDDSDGGNDAGTIDAGRARGVDPAIGWSVALPYAADAGSLTKVGVGTAMALDQFKQPLIAALIIDPNSDGVASDNSLVFTRWNGSGDAGYQVAATIEIVGAIAADAPSRPVALARDSSTGRIGVVYPNETGVIRYAWSDDEGEHWSEETVSVPLNDNSAFVNPVLAMQNGALHVAYVARPPGCAAGMCGQVIHRTRATPEGTFVDAPASGSLKAREYPIALALSSTGTAGIAFFSDDSAGVTTLSYFDGDPPVTIASSTSPITTAVQKPSVSLDLTNDVPSVAYHLLPATGDGQLWYAKATSASGDAWGTPVALPRNGPTGMLDGTQWFQAIAYDGTGKIDVIGNFQNRTTSVPQLCGGPKLGTSSDGVTWAVCHPPESGGQTVHTFEFGGLWVNMASHANGKITLAMGNDSRANQLIGGGVVVYRQP